MAPQAREFEDAILADPDDAAAYLVYADWLQAADDPRGELIVLQHRRANAHGAERDTIDEAIRDHLAIHREVLLGPLATFGDAIEPKKRRRGRQLDFEWRNGFVESLKIGWGMYEQGGTRATAKAELIEILSHPSCRFVTSLELGPAPSEDHMSLAPLLEALVETGCPAALRHLAQHTGDWDMNSTSTGDFGAVAARFRGLRSVKLEGGEVTLGDALDLPELRMFTVQTGGLTKTEIRQICEARWPALEALNVWFGSSEYGGDGRVGDLHAILDGQGLPKLRHLGLMNCPWIDEVVEVLATSRILPRLASLDLSMGALSDDGVAHLLAHPDAFRHLASINIDDNAVGIAMTNALARFTPPMALGEQDPARAENDLDSRYCAVGE